MLQHLQWSYWWPLSHIVLSQPNNVFRITMRAFRPSLKRIFHMLTIDEEEGLTQYFYPWKHMFLLYVLNCWYVLKDDWEFHEIFLNLWYLVYRNSEYNINIYFKKSHYKNNKCHLFAMFRNNLLILISLRNSFKTISYNDL